MDWRDEDQDCGDGMSGRSTNISSGVMEARERGGAASIEIDAAWRAGLRDLVAGGAIVVLT